MVREINACDKNASSVVAIRRKYLAFILCVTDFRRACKFSRGALSFDEGLNHRVPSLSPPRRGRSQRGRFWLWLAALSSVKLAFCCGAWSTTNGILSLSQFATGALPPAFPRRQSACKALETEAQRDQQDAEEDEEAANQPNHCQSAGSGLQK